MTEAVAATMLSLAWLAAIFVPLEWALPAWRSQRRRRVGLATDLAFMLGQYLVFASVAVAVLAGVDAALSDAAGLAGLRGAFRSQPLALQALEAIVAGDLLMYWGHRAQHRWRWLWRFHAVHHTTPRLDWLAAHREHPVDGIYTQTLMNLPAIVLGLPVELVAGLVAFRGLWAIFIHANVNVRLGPLEWMFGSPRLHHWHHARDRDAGNYGNLAPYLDLLFGTHVAADGPPPALGIAEPHPRGYVGLLLFPFRRATTK